MNEQREGVLHMNRPVVVVGIVIIVNACIWGFTMIMASRALSGTGAYEQIQNILAAGAASSLIVVGGGLGRLVTRLKSKE
jgi:hypothetical protein